MFITVHEKRNRHVNYDSITKITKKGNRLFITDEDNFRTSFNLNDIITIEVVFNSDEIGDNLVITKT
jgi:hypothetical protein